MNEFTHCHAVFVKIWNSVLNVQEALGPFNQRTISSYMSKLFKNLKELSHGALLGDFRYWIVALLLIHNPNIMSIFICSFDKEKNFKIKISLVS